MPPKAAERYPKDGRFLVQLTPDEHDRLNAAMAEVFAPGRENRAEFVRDAIFERIRRLERAKARNGQAR